MNDFGAVQPSKTPFGVHVHAMYMATINEMSMGMYAVLYVYASACSDQFQNGSKPLEIIGLNAYTAGALSKNRNLAKWGHNLAVLVLNLAVTSPSKSRFALALFNKARIARLEGSYPYIHARDVHHVCVMYMYTERIGSNTKLTSSNLVTSPTDFLGCVQPLSQRNQTATCLATLPQRASFESSRQAVRARNTTRHVPTSGPTTRLPKWHSEHRGEPHRMVPPWPKTSSKGSRNSSQVSESFFRLPGFWRSPCNPAISNTTNGARPLPVLRRGLKPTIATTRCFATRGSELLTVWSKVGETSPVKDALVTSLKPKGVFPHGNQQLAK